MLRNILLLEYEALNEIPAKVLQGEHLQSSMLFEVLANSRHMVDGHATVTNLFAQHSVSEPGAPEDIVLECRGKPLFCFVSHRPVASN